MSRVLVGCVTMLVVLTTAVAADAKGPTRARACGGLGCAMISDLNLISLALRFDGPFDLLDPPRPAPFYKVEFSGSHGPGFPSRYLYVPSRDRIRVEGQGLPYWRFLPGVVRYALERMTRGLKPYPAPRRWSRTTGR